MPTALTNVRVFNGHGLTEPTTVFIDGPSIVEQADDAEEMDGRGRIAPGLRADLLLVDGGPDGGHHRDAQDQGRVVRGEPDQPALSAFSSR